MNDINCDIIRDLLPLYADGVCSASSEKAVEEHIEHCTECRAQLEGMKACPVLPPSAEDTKTEVRKMSKRIVKNKKKAVVRGVLITLAIVLVVSWFAGKGVLLALAEKGSGYNMYVPKITVLSLQDSGGGVYDCGGLKINPGEGYSFEEQDGGAYKMIKTETDFIMVLKTGQKTGYDEAMSGEFFLTRYAIKKGMEYNGVNVNNMPCDDISLCEYLLSADAPSGSAFSFGKEYIKCLGFYAAVTYAIPIADSYYTFKTEKMHGWGYGLNVGLDSLKLVNSKGEEYSVTFRGDYELSDIVTILSTAEFG